MFFEVYIGEKGCLGLEGELRYYGVLGCDKGCKGYNGCLGCKWSTLMCLG